MSKIVKLKVVKKSAIRLEANLDCVSLLQKALADARKGKIQSAFIVGVGPDTEDGAKGDLVLSGYSPCESIFTMLGGIENLKLEFQQKEIEHR